MTSDPRSAMAKVLAEVEAALPNVIWTKPPRQNTPEYVTIYEGTTEGSGWRFVVLVWKEHHDGREEHTAGADGTASKGGIVFRLTRELAEKAGENAANDLKYDLKGPGK